jgi:Mn2+/Fe2+ NRAMP family transporter
MKKATQLALGILTSVGGFFDVGNIATSAQAGASFRFQLIWALVLATILVIFLVEMSGRFAAVSQKALPDAIREHLGFGFWFIPFIILTLTHFLILSAEIGGISFALQLVTGIKFSWFAMPVALLVWLFLWRSKFNTIENSTSLLGLITLCFVGAAIAHHPSLRELGAGALPSLPTRDPMKYWFIAVSLLGSVLAPYLFYFYSSGAIEDKWDETYVGVNRGIAFIGMSFGAVIALGALVVSALVLGSRGIEVDDYQQAALMLTKAFPFWGFVLFAAAMGIACLGAALEVSLSMAYATAQTFGWNWGEDLKPSKDARFSLVYTGAIFLSALVIAFGVDPLKLTLLTMVINAAVMPFVTLPFLLLMNDAKLLHRFKNGWLSNAVVLFVTALSIVLAIVSIPLAIVGGS